MLFLRELGAKSIRNLDEFRLEPASGLNFFHGPNASGKTSVLETVYLLSRLKSFRGRRISDVIRKGCDSLQVYARGCDDGVPFTAGIEKGRGLTRLRFNGQPVKTASEQAKRLPVFLLLPDHQRLYIGPPRERRRWLDWSLFHVEQDYIHAWTSYHRALRHRNVLLKSSLKAGAEALEGWERRMGIEAMKIDRARADYLAEVNLHMNQCLLPKVVDGEAEIAYIKGDYETDRFADHLAGNRDSDQRRGYTGAGPHQADVSFSLNGDSVGRHLSRGQVKLFGGALISAQLQRLKDQRISALLLVDDLDAELDPDSSRRMLDMLLQNEAQTFISLLKLQDWTPLQAGLNTAFHVKQGVIRRC